MSNAFWSNYSCLVHRYLRLYYCQFWCKFEDHVTVIPEVRERLRPTETFLCMELLMRACDTAAKIRDLISGNIWSTLNLKGIRGSFALTNTSKTCRLCVNNDDCSSTPSAHSPVLATRLFIYFKTRNYRMMLISLIHEHLLRIQCN